MHALVCHVVGSAAGQASPREFARQVLAGRSYRHELGLVYWWDGMNQAQVHERAGSTPAQLAAEWDDVSRRALDARSRMPRTIARLPLLGLPQPVGRQPLAYLFDVGFTRDLWMHRIDLAEATGRSFEASAGHDGRIVADLVAEWAHTHGMPFELTLTGPAGGEFVSGNGGGRVVVDAVTFCRTLAGRLQGEGLLSHPLPL